MGLLLPQEIGYLQGSLARQLGKLAYLLPVLGLNGESMSPAMSVWDFVVKSRGFLNPES